MKSYIIDKKLNGIRLDNFIKLHIKASFGFLQMMDRKKIVKVNDKHPKDYKLILKENDIIKIYLNDDLFIDKNLKPNFDIIYEDNNILIVDKDKHVKVHSDNKDEHNTLIDYVCKYLIDKNEYIPSLNNSFKPAILTRLDTNTSGLVLIAKNKDAYNELKRQLENNEINKTYIAKVKGYFDIKEGILKDYLIVDEKNSKVKIYKEYIENSKEIITGYKVVDEKNNISTLEVTLFTGRTHQIRAHLAFYNHPIIGDNKYGDQILNKKLYVDTQKLTCYKITFGKQEQLTYKNLENKTFVSNK